MAGERWSVEQEKFVMDFLRQEVQQEYQACINLLIGKIRQFAEQQQTLLHREIVSQIVWRLKSEQSILAKLRRKKREKTNANIYRYINDLAGIRIVCLYLDDIDRMRTFLEMMPDIRILKIKDFIKKPKNSGYQSLHMQVQFPNERKVEIQIRTMGMDYWSVMEHELQYKKKSKIGRSLRRELLACANDMHRMDERMQAMRRLLDKQNKDTV